MSKVIYKTSTSNNNNFQKALMNTLKTMGIHPNMGLDILKTDDKKVIIQQCGEWNHEINFEINEKFRATEKLLIQDTYHDNHYHVSLTPEQMNLLEWLEEKGLLSHETIYTRLEDFEFEEI